MRASICSVGVEDLGTGLLDATHSAVDVVVGRRANWTVVAILLYAQKRVIKQRPGALLDLTRRSEFSNGLTGPSNHDALSSLYPGNKAGEVRLRGVDIDGLLAHFPNLAKTSGLRKVLHISCAQELLWALLQILASRRVMQNGALMLFLNCDSFSLTLIIVPQ